MKTEKAALAGEMSGHMFFADRYFGYDDAIYASCRLIEILAKAGKPLSSLLADLPATSVTPEIRVDCPDAVKFDLVERVTASLVSRSKSRPVDQQPGLAIRDVITIDGIRVIFEDGWGLIRASNTQPALVLRFEASSPDRLTAIRALIETELADQRRSFAI
jgi:phosphomannomutase/phosphoglucomutase